MNNQLKNILAIALVVAVFAFAFGYLNYVNSYSRSTQPSSYRSFSVSGEGKIVAVPDVAQFTFSVITEGGKDMAALQKENTEKTNSAIDFLKKQGIEQKDIKTASYNISPRYQDYNCRYYTNSSTPCPPAEIVGYTITQMVSVKIRDFSKIGQVLSGVVDSGANSVSSLSFTIDDRTALENQAKEQAIKQAREKAQLVAKAGGFNVGRLLSVDEGYTPYYAYGLGSEDSAKMVSLESAAPSPTIEAGSQEIKVNVTLRYEIE